MGRPRIDLSNRTFGRWVVTRYSHNDENQQLHWWCKCSCGTERAVKGSRLRAGDSTSCGCWNRDKQLIHGHASRRFKNKATPAYATWLGIRARCFNESEPAFPYYGGRGITVSERWSTFDNFYKDMGDPPKGYSLDRIDTNREYSPENCRWATDAQQARNRRGKSKGTSQYKGVVRFNAKFWRARITIDGRQRSIGLFQDERIAAQAYDRAALEAWGTDAFLNFPSGE